MKHYSMSIGICAFLLPTLVSAQCPESTVAKDLLRQAPVGHYTAAVLKRATEGIQNAKDSPSSSTAFDLSNLIHFNFLSTIESAMYMLVNTDIQTVEYSRNLTEITACLHIDLAMLEAKLEEVRCEINAAYDAKSPKAIRKLIGVLNFINGSYTHLVKGALEPIQEDTTWKYYNEFDTPYLGWCCVLNDLQCTMLPADECSGNTFYDSKNECVTDSTCVFTEEGETEPKYETMCPFDSNYLIDNGSGYGCQEEVIRRFGGSAFEAVAAEASAIETLTATRNAFISDIDPIKDVTFRLDAFMDNSLLSDAERAQLVHFGEVKDIKHKRVFGCNADIPPEARITTVGEEGVLTPGVKPSEEWGSVAVRGPFFFAKDHLSIWKKFFSLQRDWAREREFPMYLRNADEFPDEKDRKDAVQGNNYAFGLMALPREEIRAAWLRFMEFQAKKEATILPIAQDTQLEVQRALLPLRAAMKKNIELVNTADKGLRKFARNFAYFLRRSCIYRPCNEKLDTIMKVLYSNDCFPYASGTFTVQDEYKGDPQWKKCQEAMK